MSDKQFELFGLVVAVALAIWYYLSKRNAQSQETPGQIAGAFPSGNWPMTSVPPSTFMPPSLGQLELNINNPNLGMLSNQYIPLFGFTGMAQGTYYG